MTGAFEPQHFRVWCFQPCDMDQNMPLDCHIVPWTSSSLVEPKPASFNTASVRGWSVNVQPHASNVSDVVDKCRNSTLFSAYCGFAAGALGNDVYGLQLYDIGSCEIAVSVGATACLNYNL